MNMTTEKQARLDAFEILNRWPELKKSNFWPIEDLILARRASRALYNADVAQCNDRDEARAARRTERAEKRARAAATALVLSLFESFLLEGVKIRFDFVRVSSNGYGFRFLELNGRGQSYKLIN